MTQVTDVFLDSRFWIALGSIGTFLAFVTAFVAILRDVLGQRAAVRRAQSKRVSGWVTPADKCQGDGTTGIILNASDQPVYRLVAWLVRLQGGGGPSSGEEVARLDPTSPVTLGIVPPGRYRICLPQWDPGMHAQPGLEVAFTDADGRHWIRRAEGRLIELRQEPVAHYRIGLPQGWTLPVKDQ